MYGSTQDGFVSTHLTRLMVWLPLTVLLSDPSVLLCTKAGVIQGRFATRNHKTGTVCKVKTSHQVDRPVAANTYSWQVPFVCALQICYHT